VGAGGAEEKRGDNRSQEVLTMRPDDLINAVALLGDIPAQHVPKGDIQDLIKRYYPFVLCQAGETCSRFGGGARQPPPS